MASTEDELKAEIERLKLELDQVSREKTQSFELGLTLIVEKAALEERCGVLECLFEDTKQELEMTQEALKELITIQEEANRIYNEQANAFLNASVATDSPFTLQMMGQEEENTQVLGSEEPSPLPTRVSNEATEAYDSWGVGEDIAFKQDSGRNFRDATINIFDAAMWMYFQPSYAPPKYDGRYKTEYTHIIQTPKTSTSLGIFQAILRIFWNLLAILIRFSNRHQLTILFVLFFVCFGVAVTLFLHVSSEYWKLAPT